MNASTQLSADLVAGRVRVFEDGPVIAHDVRFLPSGERIAVVSFKTVSFRSAVSGAKVGGFAVADDVGSVQAWAVSPRGDRFLWSSERGGLRLLDLSGRSLTRLAPPADAEGYLSQETPGLASFGGIHYPDGSYEDRSNRYPAYQAVCGLAVSPDARLCAAAHGQAYVLIWDLEAGALRCLLGKEPSGRWPTRIYRVAWAPDGRRVATRDDRGAIRLWDVETRSELLAVHTRDDPPEEEDGVDRPDDMPRGLSGAGGVGAIGFVPDATCLAAGDGPVVRLWDVSTGREMGAWVGHGAAHPILGPYRGVSRIHAIHFSADGRRALTIGVDSALRVWDVRSGQEIWGRVPAPCCVDHGDISPDGRWVIWAGCPGMRLYEVG